MNQNPKRSTWGIDLKDPHPCIRLELTNKPVWKTGHDGTAHALIPQDILASLHGPDCHTALRSRWEVIPEEKRATHPILGLAPDGKLSYRDYEGNVVLQFSEEDDFLDLDDALAHASEPSDAKIDRVAATIELPDDFDQIYEEAQGNPPNDDDRRKSKRMTAKSLILDEREHMLLGLPKSAIDAIEKGVMGVIVIRQKCHADITRRGKRTVDLHDLIKVQEKWRVNMYRRFDTDPVRYLALTSKLEEDGSFRGIAFVEMPYRDRRGNDKKGLIVVFPKELLEEVLIEKHWYIAVYFESWLERHPPMRYKHKPPRRRGQFRGRRHEPSPPDSVDEGDIDDDEMDDAEPSSAQLPA